MRTTLAALAVLALTACNQAAPPMPTPVNYVAWADVPAQAIWSKPGVSYAVADGAAVVSNVADDAESTGWTGGMSVRLSAAQEAENSGHTVKVTVRAFSPDAGAMLGIAYSTADVGNSGWQQFPLTAAPADYTFTYYAPPMNEGRGDFVGFRSYGASTVHVVGYAVEVDLTASPASATPAPQPTAPARAETPNG
jgi:hypothetical protein